MSKPSFVERALLMDDATWARHVNPLSGWSRVPALIFIALPIWFREPLGWWMWVLLGLALLWIWINPRLFGMPQSTDNWMSQVVLGERIWLARKKQPVAAHHRFICNLLLGLSGLGLVPLIYGLWVYDLGFVVAGLILAMGAKLWYGDRMVWLYRETMAQENAD